MIERLKRFISGAAVPPAVQAEIVAALYPKSFRIGTSILTSVVTGVVLAAIMRSWLPLAWMAVALAICAIRTVDWWRYIKSPQAHTPSEWARRFIVRFLPFGIWWGVSATVLLLSNDPLLMAVAVLAADAQGAGAVCSYPGHPPAALSFILPAMLIFAVIGVIHGGTIGYSICFVELTLIGNYVIIIREFYRSTIHGLIARHEKSELADHLAEAHLALKREGAAKSEFLAHMSHELRTPLNAIIGFSDVSRSEVFGPVQNAKYAEYQADIHGAALHLLDIVNDVLDIARIEAGGLTLQIDDTDPVEIAQFTARLIHQRALIKGLTLEIALDPALTGRVLRTDEIRLRQALINVLTNAVKFTPSGGAVRLSAGIRDGVYFEVSDNGIGMSAEDLERALLPFVQVGRPMLAQDGSGLGLPLSRQLVERLGGCFEITSSVGIGTTITITMPDTPPAQ
jgi:two-component system cell cycle sensor histidine kinase PleC